MLRVLLVTEAASAGVGRHFLDLAGGLKQAGCDVVGVYSSARSDAQFRNRLTSEDLPPMISLNMRRAVRLSDAWTTLKLIRLARKHGPFDIIHGHSSKGGAYARLAARWLGIPSVYTPNAFVTMDPTLRPLKRRIYAQIERLLARKSQAIIAVSHEEAEHAKSLGIARHKIHVVANAIAPPQLPTREEARRTLGIQPEWTVIGFVGRLSSQKAPEVLLRAFAAALPMHPEVRLAMIGDGPLEAESRQLAATLGIDQRVLWLGNQPGQAAMPAFDLYCLSSRYEGLPYVLLEGIAAGLPIVATNVSGVSMVVKAGENGIVVPIDQPTELAQGLTRLLSDQPLRTSMGASSLARSHSLTLSGMVEQTIAVYHQAIAATGTASKS